MPTKLEAVILIFVDGFKSFDFGLANPMGPSIFEESISGSIFSNLGFSSTCSVAVMVIFAKTFVFTSSSSNDIFSQAADVEDVSFAIRTGTTVSLLFKYNVSPGEIVFG